MSQEPFDQIIKLEQQRIALIKRILDLESALEDIARLVSHGDSVDSFNLEVILREVLEHDLLVSILNPLAATKKR